MTVHAVLVEPPRPGLALPGLAASAPVDEAEAARLYAAMVADTLRAVERCGGDLLVNYPAEEQVPEDHRGEERPEAELRALAERVLDEPDEARFEVQVGSSFAARAGNAATHLLREEDADSVAILDGTAPTVGRTDLDGAAMRLRRNESVIGPAPGGRVHYLGLTEPIDFEAAFDPPEVETLVERAVAAGHEVDFLSMHPVVRREPGLVTLVAILRARRAAEGIVPPETTAVVEDLGLRVGVEDGRRRIVRRSEGAADRG